MSTRSRSTTSSNSRIGQHPSLALNTSYDEEIVPLLTTIDRIRNRVGNIDTTIDLPAIIVIGEQSSGKSSVLEALSGVPLPRGGHQMTTKCPLELRMRHSTTFYANLECGRRKLHDNILDINNIGNLINVEQNRLTQNRDQISKQVLSLNIQAPWLPNLTLIDLPGIIQVTSRQQDNESVNRIRELIEEYLGKSSTIILAIIQANNDIETSAAIKYAQTFDPEGDRTIGVLTKLDLVDRGSEDRLLEVFENRRIPLKHGYFMVKCRSQEDITNEVELTEALRKEERFFLGSLKFNSIPKDRRGCSSLARFLTHQLVRSIKQSIPRLITDIHTKMNDVEEELRELGVNDYRQLLLTDETRSRCLTDKLFASMQLFRTEIHNVEEGAQVNNPFYAKRNELNKQFFDDVSNCKFDNNTLIGLIRSAMTATQGPEPIDYILFRITKTVCLNYIELIRTPMKQYMLKMFEHIHDVVSNVIKKTFHMHPNLWNKMRSMQATVEQKLKVECEHELDLIIQMESSFVYADNQLYKERLQQNKRIFRQHPNEAIPIGISRSTVMSNIPGYSSKSSTATSLKRSSDVMNENNDSDDSGNDTIPRNKIPRTNNTSTSSQSSSWWRWPTTSQDTTSTAKQNSDENHPSTGRVSKTKRSDLSTTTAHNAHNSMEEEVLEYKIRILTMLDIICQRIILSFPQRIEFHLVRKQFHQLDLQSTIFISTNLDKLEYLMVNNPDVEHQQKELVNKRKLYDEIIVDLEKLNQQST